MTLNTLEYIAREVFSSIRRNVWLSLASVLTVMISLVILGASILFLLNASNLAENFESQLEIAVFAEDDLTTLQVEALGNRLKGLTGVQSVEFTSKEQALQEFSKSMSSKSIISDLGDTNPLPDKYTVRVTDPQQVGSIAADIDSMTGVENVVYGNQYIDVLLKFTNWLRWAGIIIVLAFASAALVLISLNIKMNVFSRRREIQIMKLVGASNGFIRWPFLIEGMILGLVGGVLSILIVGFGYNWLVGNIQSTLVFIPVVAEGTLIWQVLGILVLTGMALGAAGSAISLRKFLKA